MCVLMPPPRRLMFVNLSDLMVLGGSVMRLQVLVLKSCSQTRRTSARDNLELELTIWEMMTKFSKGFNFFLVTKKYSEVKHCDSRFSYFVLNMCRVGPPTFHNNGRKDELSN